MAAAVGLATMLVGMYGQNPFNRESDPTKKYPTLSPVPAAEVLQ